jgi:hypothetical protein
MFVETLWSEKDAACGAMHEGSEVSEDDEDAGL